ncbi:MAG TPA: hypothetical protein VFN67_21075 [Polyangiales bacterium]|nr:hypothetical protein [Polyangiales bacterium]
MKQSARLLALSCVMYAARAAADDVHLDNGEVIEGRATRSGDRIVIEMESGQISLGADSVKHIEENESSVERYEKQYQALKPEDVGKRLQLADYCRDHGMRERERKLLEQIIEREPNHEQARTRLGYVKTPAGWVTYAEHMRAAGNVQRDGQWMTREQASELDRTQAQARAAARSAATESELEAKKVALERQKLEVERERLEVERSRAEQRQPPVVGYYGGYGVGYRYVPRSQFRPAHSVGRTHSAGYEHSFPINGVRDPRDNSWAIPGTRNPRDTLP